MRQNGITQTHACTNKHIPHTYHTHTTHTYTHRLVQEIYSSNLITRDFPFSICLYRLGDRTELTMVMASGI